MRAALVAVLGARPLGGQALTATELGVGALATWARRDFYGGGVELALRPSSDGRIAFSAAGGSVDRHAGMRVEATAQFLVLPTAKTGVSPYAGVGIAYVGSRAYRGTGVLMVLVGCESAAGRPRGWFGELGLGE
ncbi:MAG TPA: hypothetical protein VKB63_14670, partial [Gemmatimonadales bacterium]|nr:hypothetical protein [Gemmatimonadales bacterium]